MWTYNNNYNQADSSSRIWNKTTNDSISKENFDFLKQELQSVRFYSKCLSGATYLPANQLDDIYDILSFDNKKNWYIGNDSQYSFSDGGQEQFSKPINLETSDEYYNKFLSEYGMTLKNLFTPKRLIDESIKNYIYIDVATTEELEDIEGDFSNIKIDGIRLKEGQRILVKDQKSRLTLLETDNPEDFFIGRYYILEDFGGTREYEFYNEENGIYIFKNKKLVREGDLDDYNNCIRFSIVTKLGNFNRDKQWHIVRLKNGYYPTTLNNEPIEFEENHNYILRNRIDYNNIYEISYYDVITLPIQSYKADGVTYSIPERIISVGEFGVILNHQNDVSHIIYNKYKVNLRSITQTTNYYWICGDDATVLKVRKHDFFIEKIFIESRKNFKSISFFNDLKGVIVGEFNTILVTSDGGKNWEQLNFEEFDSYSYNKIIYYQMNKFFIGGNGGIFLEISEDDNGWVAYKRRISKIDNEDEEFILVEHINDLNLNLNTEINILGELVNLDLLYIITNNYNLILYDINNVLIDYFKQANIEVKFDFFYIDLLNYGDIRTISRRKETNTCYFASDFVYEIKLDSFSIKIDNNKINSNIFEINPNFIKLFSEKFVNKILDDNNRLILCGNNSLFEYINYPINISDDVQEIEFDEDFNNRLKPRLLFLDYDMGSKLNFFDDNQEYRLPEKISIDTLNTIGLTFSFTQLENYSNFSNIYIKELNWLSYYSDRLKTFEYFGNNISDSKKVLMSFDFYHSSNSEIVLQKNDIRFDMGGLAPNINITNSSRYYTNSVSISLPTFTNNTPQLYLEKYLGILRTDKSFSVEIGDVIELKNNLVDGKFIVNRIISETNRNDKFIYFFTEFNQNITNELKSTSNPIHIKNLNTYSTREELVSNLINHPISVGYNFDLDNNLLNISSKFSNMTAYYNMAVKIIVGSANYEMKYRNSFLSFGYSPTYNILSYLEGINSKNNIAIEPLFSSEKEYYSMPIYFDIPFGQLQNNTIFISFNQSINNRILFGIDLKLEWESFFINTFVDISIETNGQKYESEKLLIVKKYFDKITNSYVMEFHKSFKYPTNTNNIGKITIKSRRKLKQISDDLQELNNINRSVNISDSKFGTFSNFERELNFKFNTDSYAKILLSDVVTVEQLTGIIYTDYKNEIAMNITNLDREVIIPIISTSGFNPSLDDSGELKLNIECSEKHELSSKDGVVLEFIGGVGSSQILNQQYFGFHTVVVKDEYSFYVDIPYSISTTIGNDIGFVKYIKNDPFLNYYPVDLFDVGVDHRPKQSVELNVDNLKLSGDKFSLVDVDFKKYRFRLVDGLDINTLSEKFHWVLEAEISDAIIGLGKNNELIWYKGIWECGRWFGGTWISGTWISGDWYSGIWESNSIKDKFISVDIDKSNYIEKNSQWYNGRWFGGSWNGGVWRNGRWYGGIFSKGKWYNGIWNDGQWENGEFIGGIWVMGSWFNGVFNTNNEPSFWLDGRWYGGDFENGVWFNGIFEQKFNNSRFGVKSTNTRTSIWHGGKWVSGNFHSFLKTNEDGNLEVSDSHRYSFWYTGIWMSGDWYGGIAFNIDFRSGTWHGGILEDIEVIGTNSIDILPSGSTASSIILNGLFKFNPGDELNLMDYNNEESNYKVLYIDEDDDLQNTKVFVAEDISSNITFTELRLVSRFKAANWKSGIWTNGIYESGLWEGGMWYNGIFLDTWG
jgi:hypothetical protein